MKLILQDVFVIEEKPPEIHPVAMRNFTQINFHFLQLHNSLSMIVVVRLNCHEINSIA